MKKALKALAQTAGLQRHHVAAARMFCERQALARVSRTRARGRGRILCYHSVGQPSFGVNDVTPTLFRRHIELALEDGYRFVPARDIAATGGGDKDLAITFDDAATSVATAAEPILSEYKLPWTLFAVSSWSDHATTWARENLLTWNGLSDLLSKGAEIGSHSVSHPDFGRIEQDQIVDELELSRRAIEKHLGFAPETFAIPLGQSMNWTPAAHRAAEAAGYKIIYAQAEETRPEGTVPRTFVTRFDDDRIFRALLGGAFDRWEEWV
jgi:peptidoglycan/xylan/chitin deacetylase (PgdA/CDA1 family)